MFEAETVGTWKFPPPPHPQAHVETSMYCRKFN